MECNFNLNIKENSEKSIKLKSVDLKNRIIANIEAYAEYHSDLYAFKKINNRIEIELLQSKVKIFIKLQTGNWAIAYRDFFEFITERNDHIICYCTLSRELGEYFSDGIVSSTLVSDLFIKSKKLINNKIIFIELCQIPEL